MTLYQQVLLNHYRNPQNHGLAEDYVSEGSAVNPVCGDQAAVRLTRAGDQLRMTHLIEGCAICKASASVLSELVSESDLGKVPEVVQQFADAITGKAEWSGDHPDVAAFSGVSAFPARVHCALLPVTALSAALARLN